MRVPAIAGIIERRILINYQVDPKVIEKILPKPFMPKLVNGKAIAGICLIRLIEVRPKWLPAFLGISSENGAHRISVEWMEEGVKKEGVYIPRRDTSSLINSFAGGRLFPGVHYRANFKVDEKDGDYSVAFKSEDGTSIEIQAKEQPDWNNKESVFADFECASAFMESGHIGYSPNKSGRFDGMELLAYQWKMSPLKVLNVQSSFFENEEIFPKGSVKFDNALLMKNIAHEWKSLNDLG